MTGLELQTSGVGSYLKTTDTASLSPDHNCTFSKESSTFDHRVVQRYGLVNGLIDQGDLHGTRNDFQAL